MTRWARQGKRAHDASSWEDLKTLKKGNKIQKQKQTEYNGKSKTVPDWLEKRRAARRLRRKKGKPCFHCREAGHISAECPLKEQGDVNNICFKCGATDHNVHDCKLTVKEGEYPFAKCFICKQNGHLSGQCPDNPRGLYPDGGGCKFCGSVEHYRRDCPERNGTKEKGSGNKTYKYKLREENESIDAIVSSDDESHEQDDVKKKKKVITF